MKTDLFQSCGHLQGTCVQSLLWEHPNVLEQLSQQGSTTEDARVFQYPQKKLLWYTYTWPIEVINVLVKMLDAKLIYINLLHFCLLTMNYQKDRLRRLKRLLPKQLERHTYDYMGSEVAIASEKIIYIFSLINTMYSQLQVSVMLTSLEIWSDRNKISTDGDAHDVLQRFVSWRETFLLQRSHDLAYLLVYRDHPTYVGATYHGMACDPKFAAGLVLYSKMITLEAFSVIFTQLLGIMLGLSYNNDIYECSCPGTACIMNPGAIPSHGIKFFSSCSIDEFKHTTSQPKFECLQNQTVPKLVPQGRASTCGNGVLEPPEQCDCGDKESCEHLKCCDPLNCLLLGNASCGSGPCCGKKTCKILDRGIPCRKSVDPCDFPEFCNGVSEFCVPDIRAADLQTCNNKSSYCFGGVCQDRTKQCVDLFGKFAKESTYQCTQEVNFQQDKFGNCNGRSCTFWQALCGKLVCHWTHSLIVPRDDMDIQYTYLGGHICMSASIRARIYPDPTVTKNGTMCDENKIVSHKHNGFPDSSACKESSYNAGDPSSIPGREQLSTPVFCPKNSMDRGVWQATVHEVAKTWTRLNISEYSAIVCVMILTSKITFDREEMKM
ncbi:hypothetical protein FD754_022995, partial [Muntiacus muntjak]